MNKLRKDPTLLHLCMLFFASHGMAFESTQHIVLNEYDEKKKFYRLYAAENQIRYFSELYKNCYFISIFACCREIFMPKKHNNCIAANSVKEAEEKFEAIEQEELKKNQQ